MQSDLPRFRRQTTIRLLAQGESGVHVIEELSRGTAVHNDE